MLQNLRNYFPKWLIATFLGLFSLLLVLGGLYSPSGASPLSARKVLAQVNKKKIRLSHIEKSYTAIKQQAAAENNNVHFTTEQESELRSNILENLVLLELLKQHAHTYGYRLHAKDALAMIRAIPALQVDGKFSPQHFKAVLAAGGITKTDFLKEVSSEHIRQQAHNAIVQSSFIFPKEVNQFIRLSEQQRDFSYLELEARHFTPNKIELPIEEVNAYYDQHLTQFRIPEQVSIDYVLLSRTDIRNQLKELYPNDNQAIEEKTTQRFEAVIDQLHELNNKYTHSLVEIAKILQLDIQSSTLFDKTGGSHVITKHPEVITSAFSEALRKGQNSGLIKINEDCVIVLRLKEYQPLRLPALTDIEPLVREQLSLQQAKEAARQYGEKVVEKLVKNPTEWADIPKHLRWRTAEEVKRDNQEISHEILNSVFAMSSQGEVAPAKGISLANGNYVIIRLSKVRSGKLSQLDDEQRNTYRQQLLVEMNQLSFLQYIEANKKRAKLNYLT